MCIPILTSCANTIEKYAQYVENPCRPDQMDLDGRGSLFAVLCRSVICIGNISTFSLYISNPYSRRLALSKVSLEKSRGAFTRSPLSVNAPLLSCNFSFYLGGITVAIPLITTSPSWLAQIVSSFTIFFSSRTSATVQVAVMVSPNRTGLVNFSSWPR